MPQKRTRSTGLFLSRFRRSVIYQPLAALLAVLLMPSFSWFESRAGIPLGATAKSFQLGAQAGIQGCNSPRGNRIIQTVCVNGSPYEADLDQLEADAVKAYLALHGLPASEANLIYSLGRTDLRSAIRSQMLGILLDIIAKPDNARSPHEQALYRWMQALIQQNEIAEYAQALAEYRKWQADPCSFTLDPEIAKQYGLSYNGIALCAPATVIAAGPPYVPAASYFTAFGIKNSYGKAAEKHPNYAELVTQTQINLGEMYGTALAVGTAVAAIIGISTFAFFSTIFPFSSGAAAAGALGAANAFFLGSAFLGPAAIVFICVVVGVIASFQVANNEEQLRDLSHLTNLLNDAQNNPPDLVAFAGPSSPVFCSLFHLSVFCENPLGAFKLTSTLVSQTVPDVPSAAALPARKAEDPWFAVVPNAGQLIQSSFTYDDWNGIAWRAE
ncbi:MAG TPA: hypothetical protein VH601_23220, partial [Bryobacteraceae bacterium]